MCGAGTGGTIAGVSTVLKEQRSEIQVYLIDPPGSSLYNKVSLHLAVVISLIAHVHRTGPPPLPTPAKTLTYSLYRCYLYYYYYLNDI